MRFAVSRHNVGPVADLVEQAQRAEATGWHVFFLWDHLHLIGSLRFEAPADYVGHLRGRLDIEVVVMRAPDTEAADYEAVGASWLVESGWPEGDSLTDPRARIGSGQP